jgi:3-oxoacyl-[acyl-carrier protein] reductase
MEKKSENNHVVVSGGARGLGLATVRALLDAGYAVSTFSRRSSAEVEALSSQFSGRFFFATADVGSSEETKTFLAGATAALGRVYGLVNNAAVVQQGILATLPEVEIERMVSIDLTAAIRLTRLCLKDMLYAGRGRVINISSIVGTRGYNGLSVYSAVKAGLDGFTRSLAREVGRRNVTVNSIAPGYMRTDMSSGLTDSQLDQIVGRTPLGRLAESRDVTPLLVFLMSKQASFITGEVILIDGGISS